MIRWSRRHLMMGFVGGGSAALVPLPWRAAYAAGRPRNLREAPVFITSPFQLGIASGDPSADGFVIWTRLAPEPLAPGSGMPMAPILVHWEVASDEAFSQVVATGEAIAHPELAHSVHVELAGLQPDRPYWYRFRAGSERSQIGRGRTFPQPGARADRVRFVVAGCQHYEEGHYVAWAHIAREEVDFVFHYGDYIYEGRDNGPGSRMLNGRPFVPLRRHVGQEIYSLDDYRRRYALYKGDPDLQAAHASAPFFTSFDDHEVDNNWVSAIDQDGTPPEIFRLRRAAAFQAFYEHMPLRRSSLPHGGHMAMYRSARFGDLLDAHFLDTRQYRSDQPYGDGEKAAGPDVFAADDTMLGDEQERWLFDGLANSDARWNVIAQQVMMMGIARRADPGAEVVYAMDAWTGYRHSRQRLLAHIDQHRPGNVIVVTGDAHRHFAGDLIPDHHDRPVASEYLATSISSGGDGGLEESSFGRRVRLGGNDFLKEMVDLRGYVLCDVGRDLWTGELKVLDTVQRPDAPIRIHARFASERGRPGLQRI